MFIEYDSEQIRGFLHMMLERSWQAGRREFKTDTEIYLVYLANRTDEVASVSFYINFAE